MASFIWLSIKVWYISRLNFWTLIIFIIKGFRTIVFIFIVISITFRPICPPAFFRCLSNSGNYTELRTTSFIEFMGVACSDSVSHNRVQVLRILVLFLACNLQPPDDCLLRSLRTNAYTHYAMCPAGQFRCSSLSIISTSSHKGRWFHFSFHIWSYPTFPR